MGPVLFTIFINDLDDTVKEKASLILKFADDTKVGKVIQSEEDCRSMQECLDNLCVWARTWKMEFNVTKCHVLHLGKSNPRHVYKMDNIELTTTNLERDIGVLIADNLKPSAQCQAAAATANRTLASIFRAFCYRDRTVLPKLYKQYVRPHLEFAVQGWSPWQRGDIELMERVQERMVKAVTGLVGKTYEDRLKELKMEKLESRRIRLDLIQAFKIIHGHDQVDPGHWFHLIPENRANPTRRTAGGLTLEGRPARLEIRRNFFSHRVINTWNRLPLETRMSKTVQEFKNQIRDEVF